MDIGSGRGWPSSALSNFAPHKFTIDGIECNSMEGFLQSLKFKNPDMQEYVCGLVGIKAKNKGRKKNLRIAQTLWWRGKEIKRESDEYQELLDRAYEALADNTGFRAALLKTGNANLTHNIGKSKEQDTILTWQEFCSRLMILRTGIKEEINEIYK